MSLSPKIRESLRPLTEEDVFNRFQHLQPVVEFLVSTLGQGAFNDSRLRMGDVDSLISLFPAWVWKYESSGDDVADVVVSIDFRESAMHLIDVCIYEEGDNRGCSLPCTLENAKVLMEWFLKKAEWTRWNP